MDAAHINVVLLISQEEVVHDGGLVQLGQRGHVLDAVYAAGVHRVERLPGEIRSLEVHHLRRKNKTLQCYCSSEDQEDDDDDVAFRGKKVSDFDC